MYNKKSLLSKKVERFLKRNSLLEKMKLVIRSKKRSLLQMSQNMSNNINTAKQFMTWAPESLHSGERQVSKSLDGIRADHLGRYEFVLKYIESGDKILDLACGVGYGSYILANSNDSVNVTGADISKDSIDFANSNYKIFNNSFVCQNALEFNSEEKFDKIVSFETIEHIKDDKQLLKNFCMVLKDDGLLFLSTPNAIIMPFLKEFFPFHIKHYFPIELEQLLKECGFDIIEVYSQKTNMDRELIPGWEGVFNVVVCKKC